LEAGKKLVMMSQRLQVLCRSVSPRPCKWCCGRSLPGTRCVEELQ